MLVLLAIATWIFVISIVTSLCVAARAGDQWEHTERNREIVARARSRMAESGVSRTRRNGVAA